MPAAEDILLNIRRPVKKIASLIGNTFHEGIRRNRHGCDTRSRPLIAIARQNMLENCPFSGYTGLQIAHQRRVNKVKVVL